MTLLAGDLGGTKTLLRLSDESGNILCESRFPSGDFGGLEPMVAEFLGRDNHRKAISAACFAVAGPVSHSESQSTARITNLPWCLSSTELAGVCNAPVSLINDFEAVAHGIGELDGADLRVIHAGAAQTGKPRVVLGAGTGLGVCQIVPTASGAMVMPSEGGHADFAPSNAQQLGLLRFLWERHGHVSYDRVLSGPGLAAIFEYLADIEGVQSEPAIRDILTSRDVPAAVTAAARSNVAVARKSVDMFVDVYAAQAGNLALVSLALGGVYVAGGIAPKIIDELDSSRFREGFIAKGRMRELLERTPVAVVLNEQVGLLGALAVARSAARSR
jgi:glucokinase